jgi:Fe2+ or Zn2+ uptake regulation protein
MTKLEVLEILYAHRGAITPDSVNRRLRGYYPRTSVYAYLLHLFRQQLVIRTRIGGRLAYKISPRGVERLFYLRRKGPSR